MRYSRLLEENSFANRRADYAWLLFLCASFLLVSVTCIWSSDALADMRQLVSSVATLPFLSSSLAFALVYIWSRRNPSVKMSLFGIITYVHSLYKITAYINTGICLQYHCPVSPHGPRLIYMGIPRRCQSSCARYCSSSWRFKQMPI